MRLSLLASIALTAATLLPVHSLESEARFPPSIESEATPSSEGGPLHVTDTFLGIFKCEWRHLFNWITPENDYQQMAVLARPRTCRSRT